MGDPWVPPLTMQHFNRTQIYEVIALKKKLKYVTGGGGLG
jgi:hypothetical protein